MCKIALPFVYCRTAPQSPLVFERFFKKVCFRAHVSCFFLTYDTFSSNKHHVVITIKPHFFSLSFFFLAISFSNINLADNMNTNEYPELVTFRGRQSRHSCFQNQFHGARSGAASDFIKAVVGDQANSKLRTDAGDMEEYLMAELESVTRVSCS